MAVFVQKKSTMLMAIMDFDSYDYFYSEEIILSIEVFQLLSTYEILGCNHKNQFPFRVEVFESLDQPKNYRARVWTSNFYNLYPTFLNTDKSGTNLHQMHTEDQLHVDITCILADDPLILTGKFFEDEISVVNYMKLLISKYYST